jgi:hypothetical protein
MVFCFCRSLRSSFPWFCLPATWVPPCATRQRAITAVPFTGPLRRSVLRRSPTEPIRNAVVLLCFLAVRLLCGAGGTASDAIHKSDLIVVGDVIGGSAVDQVANVECNLLVQPDRVVKGSLAQSPIQVHWQYQPRQDQPPKVTTRIERTHALWFLRKGTDGRYEAMWVEVNLRNRGGYYLEVPRGSPYGVFAYPPDAGYERKLAGEIGVALEEIARRQGNALDVRWRTAGSPAPPDPPAPQEVLQFRSLAFVFRELDASKLAEISRYLMDSPIIHLKALGLLAQLKAGNPAALLEMENSLPALAVIDDPLGLSFWSHSIDIRADADAIRAVGRMALAETQLLGFADGAAAQLSQAKNPISVPYLEVMLSHPNPHVRTTAAIGICAALQSLDTASGAELERICVLNRRLLFGQALDEGSLKSWLAAHRAELSTLVSFPQLAAPSWYEVSPEPPRREVEVSMERRFEHFLIMLQGRAGAGLRGMDPTDEATLDAICRKAAAKRKELDDDYQRLANAARVQGKEVDPSVLPVRARQYQQIVADAFSESQSQLSTDGWSKLERFLKSLPLHEYVPKAPSPFFVERRTGAPE